MRSSFTKYGGEWSTIADKSFSWKYIELPALNSYLKPLLKKTGKVIDAGCGFGRFFPYYLHSGIQEKNLIGIDPNRLFLNQAKEQFPKARFYNSLLSSSQRFTPSDLIVASYVLHLLDDKELKKTLKNFHSWLKKDGQIFFFGNHPVRLVRDELSTYYQRRWQSFPTSWNKRLKQYHRTTADYLNAFINAGFQLEHVAEPAPLPRTAKINNQEYQDYSATPCRLMIIAKKI